MQPQIPINHLRSKMGHLNAAEQVALLAHYDESNALFQGQVDVANQMLAFIEAHGLKDEWMKS